MLNYEREQTPAEIFNFSFFTAKELTPANLATNILVVGVPPVEAQQKKILAEYPFLKSSWMKAVNVYDFKGGPGEMALVVDSSAVLFVGLGAGTDLLPKKLLSLGGKIAGARKKFKKLGLIFLGDTFMAGASGSSVAKIPKDFAGRPALSRILLGEEVLERLLTGYYMGGYQPVVSGTTEKKVTLDPPLPLAVVAGALDKNARTRLQANVVGNARAVYWIRDQTHKPANVLTPETFATEMSKLVEKTGIKIKIFDEARLQKEGFGGIWAVGKGSVNPPRLVQLEYNSGLTKAPHLMLIGKGVTFDTGGISIKPAAGMEAMKHDMTGAAIAAACAAYIAEAKLPIRLTVLLPLAENRPSHNSFVPGDVFEAWGGKTVEVQNTDAEGRLILADCLAYAKTFAPDLVIDMATLTGAAGVTLGPIAFLLYGNNGKYIQNFTDQTRLAGEDCWEMPMYKEYHEDLKSNVANLRNHVGHRDGNSHIAACFLEEFVNDAYPWLHLDIASYSLSTKWKGAHCPPEVNAALPILALTHFARSFAKKT